MLASLHNLVQKTRHSLQSIQLKHHKKHHQNTSASVIIQQSGESSAAHIPDFHDIYTLGKTLGHGSFAEVKEAIKKSDNSVWATKIIEKVCFIEDDDFLMNIVAMSILPPMG